MTLVIGFVAMFLALLLTPQVSVSTFGQTIQVGAVRPPAALHLTGPGEAELFGEGTVATVQDFTSFVRPLIVWQRFDQALAASQFIQSGDSAGTLGATLDRAGQALAGGWERYLLRLVVAAALLGLVVHLVVLGAGAAGRRGPVRRPGRWLAGTAVVSLLVTAAFAGLTMASAARQLRGVTSLADLVGTQRLAAVPPAQPPVQTGVDVVVIGDSTAAGDGNAPLADPTAQDTACSRSRDSYAARLQAITRSTVLNLACSSATIAHGLLGSQSAHGVTLPAQVGVLESMTSESAVIVSVGANDVGWRDFLAYCAAAQQCDDRATEQLFQSRLDTFKIQYAQLLQQLADLPGHPTVIVNEYYQPFGASVACLAPGGGTPGAVGDAERVVDAERAGVTIGRSVLGAGLGLRAASA